MSASLYLHRQLFILSSPFHHGFQGPRLINIPTLLKNAARCVASSFAIRLPERESEILSEQKLVAIV